MKSGIKFKDIEIGNGQEAKEDDWVLIEVYFFLNKGEEINIFENYSPNHQIGINLKSRDVIPGLRYGIVGMREGGTREIKISPHLAYGEKGVGDKIPPNAVIRCKVRLLRIFKDKACFNNRHRIENHFIDRTDKVGIGSGSMWLSLSQAILNF